jgi:hypothetical protein
MALLYPGDAYMDRMGLHGYNKYSTWLSFTTSCLPAAASRWLMSSAAVEIAA